MTLKMKIRHQILMVFIVTGLVPMLLIAGIAFWYAADTLNGENIRKMETYNGFIEERFAQYFLAVEISGLVLSELTTVVSTLRVHRDQRENDALWQATYPVVDRRMEGLGEQLGLPLIFVVDLQGQAIYASGIHKETVEGADLSDRLYIQQALAGKQNWSSLFYSDIIHEHVIVLSTPVRDHIDGQILGVINAMIPLECIERMLHDSIRLIGDTGDAYLVNADGLLLTNTVMEGYREGVAMSLVIETEAVRQLREPIQQRELDFVGSGHYTDYRGEYVLGSFGTTTLGSDVVGLVIKLDGSEVLAPLYRLMRFILGITLFVALATTFSAILIGKRVETVILHNQAHFRLLAEAAPVGVLLSDGDQRVIYMNPRISTMLGYTIDDMPSVDQWWPLAYPDESLRAQVREHWQKEIMAAKKEKREMPPMECPVTCKDGSVKQIEFRATTTGSTNIVLMIDATQRKEIEAELLKAKQAAEAAALAKSQFLANMSHEIRTPLNGVMGMLQLIGLTELNEEQKECLDDAQQASKMLLKVINEVLDYSKIEAGMIRLETRPMSVNSVMREVHQFFLPLAAEKNLGLTCASVSDLPVQLVGDEFRLKQVLNNLMGNAIKFTKTGSVHLGLRKIDEQDDAVTLEWVVEDTGIGIDDDQKEAIFNSFTQADSSHTRRYGGTGLGLAISRSIAEHMGGTIWAESCEGKGSTFYFTCQLNKNRS